MPRRRSKYAEVWIGLMVIVSAALVIWGYFWLTGRPLEARGYRLVVMLENAQGLERGAQVRVSGVDVGSVLSVRLISANRVAVSVQVDSDVRLPRDTRASLETASLFGTQLIELYPGTAEEPLMEGDTLTARAVPAISDLMGELGDEAQILLRRLDRLLADTTIGQFHGSVAALQGTLTSLERLVTEHSGEFVSMSESLSRTARTLEASVDGPTVERTIANLDRTAATLSETADDLRRSSRSLASVSSKIDRGDGTLGMLVNDPGLYEELRTAAHSVGALLADIQENPGRYVTLKVF